MAILLEYASGRGDCDGDRTAGHAWAYSLRHGNIPPRPGIALFPMAPCVVLRDPHHVAARAAAAGPHALERAPDGAFLRCVTF
jgi:hypothetical protein